MAWQTGEKVGPYEIVAQLGQGGMATVYKAYHPQLDRHVAIKVMHQTYMDDESFVTRFRREAQIVARLQHAHIVPVYDFNEYKGQPYLVMKYIEGQTLKQRMFKSPPALDDILYVMTAVGSALTYAHNKGVLHRDVKPSNIVIDNENIPYLADFGLARIAAAGESTLSADVLLGTPNYISPEQAGGRKDLDGRTDIYSFGIVLYELLVGQVPFSADTPYAVIHDHIYTPLPEPSKINPEIPLSVESVLLKITAKKPEDRYNSADEAMHDLKAAIDESRLEDLSPDRDSLAELSLSRLRADMGVPSSQVQVTQVVGSDIARRRSRTPTPSGLRKATVYQPRNHGRLWMVGGCGAFLLIGFISAGVLLGAWNNILEVVNIASVRRTPEARPLLSIAADDHSAFPGLQIYPVPEIDIPAADEIMNAPEPDAILSLAAADAYWDDDEPEKSYEAVSAGKRASNDVVTYMLTAATLADDNEDYLAASVYTLVALFEAENQPPVYNHIRPAAGEYLYDVAEELTETSTDGVAQGIIGDIYTADDMRKIDNTPPRLFLTIRVLQLNGNERAANIVMRRVQDVQSFRVEIALVQGEIALAQRKLNNATTVWQGIVGQDTAPAWVRERATELLKENNASS